jgi:hypothetical protein
MIQERPTRLPLVRYSRSVSPVMASNVIERRRVFVFGALEAKRRGRELPSSGRFERMIEGSGMTAVGDIGAV